jgi:hypothetical protein
MRGSQLMSVLWVHPYRAEMETRVLGMYVQRGGGGTNNYKGKKLLDRLPKGEISTVRGERKERARAVTGFYRTECEVRSNDFTANKYCEDWVASSETS